MNKIEKYIRLTKKFNRLVKENNDLVKAFQYSLQASRIAQSYSVEDLVSDFDSIGYKVDVDGVNKALLQAKETYKENGMKFDSMAIGSLLLDKFADAYAERRGR